MSIKPSNHSIIISCPEESGIAFIMAGYLHFYKSDMKIALSEECKSNHPIAMQVMKEDGIHIEQLELNLNLAKNLHEPIIKINLQHSNNKTENHTKDALLPLHFYVADPIQYTSYDSLVEAFRKTREEIKKISIEIVGMI